jgi:hypothetical protein
MFTLGVAQCVGRRRAIPLVASHRELSGANLIVGEECANKSLEELVARSVEVDAESELLNPLGRGESRDSERDVWGELLAETGRVRGVVPSAKG